MAVEHEISIMDRAGAEQYRLTGNATQSNAGGNGGYLSLEYTQEVNAPGLVTFSVDAGHELVDAIDLDWQVAVWRRDRSAGIDWYVEFAGLFRGDERTTDDIGRQSWMGVCPGFLHFLGRSVVAYPADTLDRTAFYSDPVETIAKTLVTRNATSSGSIADGRDRDVDAWGANISVEADAGQGAVLDYRCARKNLLAALQEVALLGGGDFDLVKTAPQQWEFRWYDGQRGLDRSSGPDSVVFALGYGNMRTPKLTRNYVNYRTVVLVGGQGVEAERTIVARSADDYQSLYRSGESFINASQHTTTAGLEAAGYLWLRDHQRNRVQLDFDVVQTPAYLYGLHYGLGDLITARYQGVEAVKKITRVTVSVQPGSTELETIKLVTENVD